MTIATVTMNAAAAAKAGWQRAAIHNRIGNSRAIGTIVVQGCCGSSITMVLMTMSNANPRKPSMVSPRAGGAGATEATPTTRGATGTTPSAWDATQFCQEMKNGAVKWGNRTNQRAPPIPETAVATIAAPRKASTWR